MCMQWEIPGSVTYHNGFREEKISGPSHNAFATNGIFVHVVMWGDSDETFLN